MFFISTKFSFLLNWPNLIIAALRSVFIGTVTNNVTGKLITLQSRAILVFFHKTSNLKKNLYPKIFLYSRYKAANFFMLLMLEYQA